MESTIERIGYFFNMENAQEAGNFLVALIALITLVYSIRAAIKYLNKPVATYVDGTLELLNSVEKLSRDFYTLRDRFELSGLQNDIISEEEKRRLADDIIASIKSNATKEYLQNIENMLRQKDDQNLINGLISENFSRTLQRLNREIEALSRRGNVNLILGMATSIFGFALLLYFVLNFGAPVWNKSDTGQSVVEVAAHFFPRLSLVILIEVFAYFFLNLYKSSLSEIKYFQNETTNIEAKYAALQLAVAIKDNKAVAEILQFLAKTERNFMLKKGETTVELERNRIDSISHSGNLRALADVLDRSRSARDTK